VTSNRAILPCVSVYLIGNHHYCFVWDATLGSVPKAQSSKAGEEAEEAAKWNGMPAATTFICASPSYIQSPSKLNYTLLLRDYSQPLAAIS
jgi:hypothetical protein